MKILHTSDWHLGKTLRGRPRLPEQREALAEIIDIAAREGVGLVLMAGDVFESASPPAEAEALFWRTVLDLRALGTTLVVIAGNHDNAFRFEAWRPALEALGVVVLGHACPPDRGSVVDVATRGGETARLALLPFVSQRHAVRAAELMAGDAASNAGDYAARMAHVIASLTARFEDGTVNLVVAHTMVTGGKEGGGERAAQLINDYLVSPAAFPATAHYVALGHLHRAQRIAGPAPLWYSGSPLQLDFGETANESAVLMIDARPGLPAAVETIPLHAGRRLRKVGGSLAELRALAGSKGDDYLHVTVREAARAGLADEVREMLPNAVDVVIEAARPDPSGDQVQARSSARTPAELFATFLAGQGIDDPRVQTLFDRLLDELSTTATA